MITLIARKIVLSCTYENNANRFDDTRRARGHAESGGVAAGVQLAAESAAGCPAGRCAGCERGATLARNEINQHPSGIAGAEERQAMSKEKDLLAEIEHTATNGKRGH